MSRRAAGGDRNGLWGRKKEDEKMRRWKGRGGREEEVRTWKGTRWCGRRRVHLIHVRGAQLLLQLA
jgi:hypothetical protein